MIRRYLLAVMIAAVSLVLGAAPAQAVASGHTVTVIKQYDLAERVDLVLYLGNDGDEWGCRQP